jgi:hypothetical protein
MTDEGDRAQQYRARAAELRAVASWMKDPVALKQMMATALEYERMAETVEKLGAAKTDKSDDKMPPTSH